jgi:hypothetical protein
MGEFMVGAIRFSVSESELFVCWSSCCTIYESNSGFVKYKFSQLQYRWCPTAFSVSTGLWLSSIQYNDRTDGIAINTRMIAGAVVQMVLRF